MAAETQSSSLCADCNRLLQASLRTGLRSRGRRDRSLRPLRTAKAQLRCMHHSQEQRVTGTETGRGCQSVELLTHADGQARRSVLLSGLAAISLLASSSKARASEVSEDEIRAAVKTAFDKTAGKQKSAVLLRLAFHDSGTFSRRAGSGGSNASVQYELKRPENSGLNRGWKVIEQTMQSLRGTPAEGRVGYADLIALGGAYAVAVTGGPDIRIRIGRQDAALPDPEGRLPVESATAAELLEIFKDKGFSPQEFVALSGAHTLGSKGFGDPVTFDNEYYKALQRRPWNDKSNSMASMIGLPSDHVLPDSEPCQPAIRRYADSQDAFFRDFSAAYKKLTLLGTSLA